MYTILYLRACENNHPCEKQCAENCGECMVPMVKTLPCGHQATLPCLVDSEKFKCVEKVCPHILLRDRH